MLANLTVLERLVVEKAILFRRFYESDSGLALRYRDELVASVERLLEAEEMG